MINFTDNHILDAIRETVTICIGDTKTFECPTSQYLHFHMVFYGRSNPGTCAGNRKVNDTGYDERCYEKRKTYLQGLCEGKGSCTFTLGETFNGDPCVGVKKYLRVEYTCVDRGKRFSCSVDQLRDSQIKVLSHFLA